MPAVSQAVRQDGTTMPGHLFIVQGDLNRLACDAWLLPTSRTLWVEEHWLDGLPILKSRSTARQATWDISNPDRVVYQAPLAASIPDRWEDGGERSFQVDASLLPAA